MNIRLISAGVLSAATLLTVGPARAVDQPPCYIVDYAPIQRTVVTWEADRPRRLIVHTELGEHLTWLNDCQPAGASWSGVFVDARTYRLRPSATHIPVSPASPGWPSSAPVLDR